MSVLIKTMEMPKNCGECQFCHTENFKQWCCPTGREDIFYDVMPEWCPLEKPKTGEWTTDEVAELLANVFGDECACNWSGNDEWLPEVCKYAETTCPSPKEANGCWKQFLIQGGAEWVRR